MDKEKNALNAIDRQTQEHYVTILHIEQPVYIEFRRRHIKHSARLIKELLDRQLKKMGTSDSFKMATNIEHLRALKDEIESAEEAILIKR